MAAGTIKIICVARKAPLVSLLRIDAARIARIVAPEPTVCLAKLGEVGRLGSRGPTLAEIPGGATGAHAVKCSDLHRALALVCVQRCLMESIASGSRTIKSRPAELGRLHPILVVPAEST
jgi:hypothetical protein